MNFCRFCLDSSYEDGTCLFFEHFGKLFTLEQCVDIFFDIILSNYFLFFSDYFLLFRDYFLFVGSTIISPSNADLTLDPAGTGKVNIAGAYTLPVTDGTANQILGTDGSGVISFVDPTAINIDGGTAESIYTSVPTIDGGAAV